MIKLEDAINKPKTEKELAVPAEVVEMERLENEVSGEVSNLGKDLAAIRVAAQNKEAAITQDASNLLKELEEIAGDFEKESPEYR